MIQQIVFLFILLLFIAFIFLLYSQRRAKKTTENDHTSWQHDNQQRQEIQAINAGAVIIPQGSKRTSKYSKQYIIGNDLLHNQKYDEAIVVFKELSEIPEETETALISLGTCYNLKGDKENAGKCFSQSLQINDKNYNALLGMASFNYKSEQYPLAQIYYQKAKSISPELPDAYWGLACAYHMMNEKKLASDNAKQFLRMVPNSRYRPNLEKMIID